MQKYHQLPADQCAKPPRPEASESTTRQFPSLGLPDASPSAFTLSRRRAQRRERDPESCLALLDVFLTLKSRVEPAGAGNPAPGPEVPAAERRVPRLPSAQPRVETHFHLTPLLILCGKLSSLTQG